MDEKITYKLYALVTNTENIRMLEAFDYTRICPDYALCFTELEPPEHSILITADDSYRLTDKDMEWLLSVRQAALDAVEQKYSEQIAIARGEFLKRFEQELTTETEKLGSGAVNKPSYKVKLKRKA